MTARAALLRDLALASPSRRRELVVALLRHAPPLDLAFGPGDRATLTDVDFRCDSSGSAGDGEPSQTERGGLVCRDARLSHVTMDRSNWSGADLASADLTDCRGRQATFDEAALDGAFLDRADLVGASFRGASLGEASLRHALLEEADFSRAGLRFANLSGAVLEGATFAAADLWGAVLYGASLEGACLAGATLTEVTLTGANLRGANLTGAALGRAHLAGADLSDADLRGAHVAGAVLTGALLRNARLEGVDLSTCDLTGVHLSNAWLERTPMRPDQIGRAVGEEQTGAFGLARLAYLSLQRNFETLGNGDGASWAYRRRRRMRKREERETAGREWRAGRAWTGAAAAVNYLTDQAAELLCDYGESVPRVLASMALVLLAFALTYGALGGVLHVVPGSSTPASVSRSPFDLVVFSLLAMTSASGEGIGLVPAGASVHLLRALEALLGIGLTGLLGFVLGNRINR